MDGARFQRMEPSGTRSVSMEMFDGILDGSFLDGTFGWNLDEFDGNLNYLDETRSIWMEKNAWMEAWMKPVPLKCNRFSMECSG